MARDAFTKIAAELEQEGFKKGYRQALKDFQREIRLLSDRLQAALDGAKEVDGDLFGAGAKPKPARSGSVQALTLQVIREISGLRGAQIVAELEKRGNDVHERTVRTALWRLKNAQLIEQREERWFPTDRKQGEELARH